MAIEEARDLKTFKLDNIVGKLLTYKTYLQKGIEELAPQQGLALKSNNIEIQLEESENDEDKSCL